MEPLEENMNGEQEVSRRKLFTPRNNNTHDPSKHSLIKILVEHEGNRFC